MKTAVIVAAGQGERMKSKEPKQFIDLLGKPMLAYSLEAFQQSETIDKIVIVTNEPEIDKVKNLSKELGIKKVYGVTAGGERRQDSVFFGLTAQPPETEITAVHDAARPMVTPAIIDNLVNSIDGDGLIPGVEVKDTIKTVKGNVVENTLNRGEITAAQTPQVFVSKSLIEAHNIARTFDFYATDDAALLEKQKYKIKVIEGDPENFKITTPEDLLLAEIVLKRRQA